MLEMFHWTTHLKGGHKHSGHAAVVVGRKLYSFGGHQKEWWITFNCDQIDPIEVHIFNTVSLYWIKLPPGPEPTGRGECPLEVPNMCSHHTAVLIEDVVYLWGGFPFCNITYTFNVDTHRWFKPEVFGTVPEARSFHSACVLEKVMYIYGGETELIERSNDIYKLDTTNMVWSLINTRGTPPPGTLSHSATIIGTKMFVFGGYGGWGVFYNNLTVFDTETNCWLSRTSAQLVPERRKCHAAFSYNGEMYIFHGDNCFQHFSDMWKFSPESFSWKKVVPKRKGPCSSMARMCCCMVGDRILIFGGLSTPDELYILDFSPTLKTLCKLAVIQYSLEQSGLPHNIRWELAAMNYQ